MFTLNKVISFKPCIFFRVNKKLFQKWNIASQRSLWQNVFFIILLKILVACWIHKDFSFVFQTEQHYIQSVSLDYACLIRYSEYVTFCLLVDFPDITKVKHHNMKIKVKIWLPLRNNCFLTYIILFLCFPFLSIMLSFALLFWNYSKTL